VEIPQVNSDAFSPPDAPAWCSSSVIGDRVDQVAAATAGRLRMSDTQQAERPGLLRQFARQLPGALQSSRCGRTSSVTNLRTTARSAVRSGVDKAGLESRFTGFVLSGGGV